MSVAAEPEIQMIEAAPQPAAGAVEEASEVASFPPPSAPLPLPSPIPASAPFEPVPTSHSGDSPDAWPEVEARTMELPARAQRSGKKMVALTLLDGTTIRLPAKPGRNQEAETAARVGPHPLGEMTARDLIKALHAVAEGADGTAIFGERVPIEAICATILSLLLRKGLMADWEFVEEIRKKK